MVGVAGKFAGCNTCRARRVKCDNERPSCKKCLNTGRECRGYERDIVFIVGTQNDQGRCSSHPHRSLSLQVAKIKGKPSASNRRSLSRAKAFRVGSPSVRLLEGSSNQIQFLAQHTGFLSLEGLLQPQDRAVKMPSLLESLPDLARRSPALESALRALCLIHLGTTKKEEKLVKDSELFNTQAMSKVRLATINPKTASNIETIAASMFLFLYEQVACTVEKAGAWRILFRGSSILVRARGPASFKSFPDHHIFVRLFRNEACFDAMSRRSATFLAEPEWRTVPWENIPKNDMDRLFDIEVLLPSIFEHGEELEKSLPSAARTHHAKELLKKCMQVDRMFEGWYGELCERSKEPLFWSTPWRMSRQASAKNLGFDMCTYFSNYLDFVDLRTALLHLYYWAALSLFYSTIQNLHGLCYEEVPRHSSSSPKPLTSLHPSLSPIALRSFPSPPASSPFFALSDRSLHQHNQSYFSQTHPPSSKTTGTYPLTPLSIISDIGHPPLLDAKYSDASILEIAHSICRTLPFILDQTLYDFGPDHSVWPIWAAVQVFRKQKQTEQMSWCKEMMNMWGREGWRFAFQVGRVDWEEYRDAGA